jgi:L-amino acid N-acyltransferase YncA
MEIRKIRPEDTKKVFELGKDAPYFCGFWPQEVIEALPNSKDVASFVSNINGDIVGFVIAPYSRTLKKMTVENMFVQEQYQRRIYNHKVISQHLANALLEEARKLGISRIDSLVDAHHKAVIKMNERNGMGFHPSDYKWGTKKIDY